MLLEERVSPEFDAAAALAGGPICLAVSGGGDSMALLRLAANWARRAGRVLYVLTVDHGLRAEAAAEAEFAAAAAREAGCEARVLKWTDPAPAQAKARRARHALLAEAAREAGAGLILTGHTRDDDVETFLMRARRGSGWRGLAGMGRISVSPVWPEGRGVLLARPLLEQGRSDLRAYLETLGQSWVDDPSNENIAYERVRWRNRLNRAPDMQARIQSILCDLKALRRLEGQRLSRWLETSVTAGPDGAIRADLQGLPPGVRQPALEMLIQTAGGGERRPASERMSNLLEDIAAGGPARARTLGGAWVVRDGRDWVFARDPGPVRKSVGPVFDGRFERAPGQAPLAPVVRMSRETLPPGEGGWRALGGDRLLCFARALAAY